MERGGSRHKAEANRLPNEADSSRPAQHEVAEEVRTRIVYFFLPTPEPMRFPEGFTCATLRPVDHDTLREADLAEQHETPEPEVMCSVKVWQIDRPFPGYFSAQYDAMTEAARRGLPPEVSPPPRDGPVDEVVESSGFVQTVCEVAVYVDQWPEADEDEEGADPLTDAFDLALEAIRSLQNGYYLTTQEPVTLISQEALPPMVPCFVRRVVDGRPEADDWSEGASAFFINDSYVTLVPGPPLDDEALDRFQAVLDTSEPGRALLGFADMLRDARAALRRGEYRTAVVSAESAAQVLLDDLLLHMLWEEGVDPVEAADTYCRHVGLSKRMRTHFHGRLSGNWSMKEGALGEWQQKLSAVRHRVVHAGYQPARLEAYDALDAVKALNDFVAMRLSANKSVRKYPRTAVALLGIEELDRRGRMARWLRDLVKDPTEPHWITMFARWRWVVHDHLNDERPYHGEDRDDRYQYVLLAQPDGTTAWWVHDRARRRVCRAAEPPDLTDAARESFTTGAAALVEEGIPEAYTMAWLGSPATVPEEDVEWLRDHVVFPQYAVMLPPRE